MMTARSALSVTQTSAAQRFSPQQAKYIRDIKAALSSDNLIIIVGAGVSISAIRAVAVADNRPGRSKAELDRVAESMSRPGLLRHGLDYLVEEGLLSNSPEDKEEHGKLISMFESHKSVQTAIPEDQLRIAASFLTRNLLEAKKIDNWYALEFEDVYQECINHEPNSILDALKELYECGARIITTNYDDLLENHIGAQQILIDNTPAAKLFFAKRARGILHVYGVWWHSAEIVFSDPSYHRVKENECLQQNLKNTLSASDVVLFVGTGGILSDPNIGYLLAWAAKHNEGMAQRNCVLARRGEEVNTKSNNLAVLWYGEKHEDLPVFLKQLTSEL